MTEGRRTAILIAAGEFPAEPSLQSLRCPKNDVAGLAEALSSPDFGLFTDPLTFINEPSHSTLRAVNRVFKEAGRDDQILIYYSGHGKQDGAGNLYLATSDTEADTLETSSIAVGTLRRLIDNYACKQVALILDCCFGGAVSKDFLKGGVDDQLKQTFHGRGIYILTASTATQSAREKEGDDYSLFTKHILQGVRQGEADHDDDGLISLDDLYEYVKTRVPKEAPQYPTKWEFGVQGKSLFIARAIRTYSPDRLRAFKQRTKDDEDYLLPDVFEQAYRVIKENQPKRDKDFLALLEELCDGRVRHGEFNSRWFKLAPAGAPEWEKKAPPPQQEKEAHAPPQQRQETKLQAPHVIMTTPQLLALALGALVTLVGILYLINTVLKQNAGPQSSSGGPSVMRNDKLTRSASWEKFNLGLFSVRKIVEASGVAFAPGLNGVLFVPDSSKGDITWMQLDENGKQVGDIKPIPLNVSFEDPEAITYGNSFFYLVTSQSNPNNGAQNAIVRFEIDPETRTLRGQPEIITDFRSFLLQNVTTIATSGAPDGRQGGLNIEGLAWDPNNERLLVGLRGPQIGGPGGQAALVPLKLRDPRGKFTRENLKVDQPEVIVLSLGGQAVRDITYDPQLKSFLIISGVHEGGQRTEFGLWEWDGQSPTPIKLMTLEDEQKPEGVTSVTINGRSYAFVVGDAGKHLKLDYKQ